MSNSRTDAHGAATASADAPALARELSRFACAMRVAALPAEVRERATHHILDALGIGLASHSQSYAEPALAGIEAAGNNGPCTVIGDTRRLSPRDAAMANGLLMHGLDYDDTHLASIIHPTVASLPAALAVGEAVDASWEQLLGAYAVGVEAAIRIGAAANGGFHHVGFHATGVVSHFSAALVAGSLFGLDERALTMAQGIAASTASGVQVFLEEGAWTKRLHPGWGALAGITAAQLARAGFVAPSRPYEGRFGLFETHLPADARQPVAEASAITEGLGKAWQMLDTAIKPYPVCHFIHGCADAAIDLRAEIDDPERIERVVAWLPEPTLPIVAEPAAHKQAPSTDYEAKFSAQFVVAMCLVRGRFGLPELEPSSLADAAACRLARKVECRVDPDSAFPRYFSGGVTVTLSDGRVLTRHVRVNKGAGERALTADDIAAKFLANASMHVPDAQARQILELVTRPQGRSVRDVARALSARVTS